MKTRTFFQIITIIVLLVGALFIGSRILKIEPPAPADEEHEHGGHGHEHADAHGGHAEHGEDGEAVKGPKGGRLLSDGDFAIEVTIYEPPGTVPQFRVYAYEKGRAIDPAGIRLAAELHRINRVDIITFTKQGGYLAGDAPVVEPHSFEVKLSAERGGKKFEWEYETFEGRVEITQDAVRKAGIGVETAGPAKLHLHIPLNGKIAPNEEQMTHIFPRFLGVVKEVRKRLGDKVEKGEVLAIVESNESLQRYELKSEIAGTVIKRHATLGELVGGQESVFTVADLSDVWADFQVYTQDFASLREGQTVMVDGGPGMEKTEAKITYISPFGSENSQTMLARAVVPNAKGEWRPGLFVTGDVIVDEVEVPIAVKANAVQTIRESDVVFINVGDFFEATPVELGRRDDEWIEIKSGLKGGERYAAENSFIVKADIGKAGAAHEH
jgi:cobalt-zinc-cadmium efflux system membrane fusion protein